MSLVHYCIAGNIGGCQIDITIDFKLVVVKADYQTAYYPVSHRVYFKLHLQKLHVFLFNKALVLTRPSSRTGTLMYQVFRAQLVCYKVKPHASEPGHAKYMYLRLRVRVQLNYSRQKNKVVYVSPTVHVSNKLTRTK